MVVDCLHRAGVARKTRVLDVGCGDGALSGVLVERLGCVVTGVDTNRLAIDLATAKFAERGYRGDFDCVTGYRYELADGSFDAAVCADVIEHVQEPLAILGEIHRVLRPGGILVITTPIRISETPRDPMHVKEWFVGEFVALCGEIFGEPQEVRTTHPVFWYEAYTLDRPVAGRLGRLGINALTKLGFDPFLRFANGWRCFTTQALVLRKSSASREQRV